MSGVPQAPDFKRTWGYGPEPEPCGHAEFEPNGHRPPDYQPYRCAKCKRPFTPTELESMGIDIIPWF